MLSNGKITGFKIKIQTRKDDMMNRNMSWENIPVKEPEVDSFRSHKFTVLKQMALPDNISARVYVTAINSAGESPPASIGIPEKALGRWSC